MSRVLIAVGFGACLPVSAYLIALASRVVEAAANRDRRADEWWTSREVEVVVRDAVILGLFGGFALCGVVLLVTRPW